jgi:hypothetical protein
MGRGSEERSSNGSTSYIVSDGLVRLEWCEKSEMETTCNHGDVTEAQEAEGRGDADPAGPLRGV